MPRERNSRRTSVFGGLMCTLNLHTPGKKNVGIGKTRQHSTCARCGWKIARKGFGFWRKKDVGRI